MSRRGNLGQRVAVIVLGTLVTVAMLLLGLWQMQVFEDQGDRDAARRASGAPIDLVAQLPRDGSVGDVYGRNVTVRGRYRGDESVVVVDRSGTRRVLTALTLDDGRVVPVVRGVTTTVSPPPPDGQVTVTGVFLPSEAGDSRAVAAGELASVRLPALQQQWPQQLTPGFVTQQPDEARAQGLSPAMVALPSQDGKFRNFGYALQWWVFAAFAVAMTVIWVRALAHRATGVGLSASTGPVSDDSGVTGATDGLASTARLDNGGHQ